MKGLILAGGHGTRLRPLTNTGPKQLIPIANKPVLFYAIEDLKEAGIKDIGIILGHNMPEKIMEAVGDGSQWGVRITYIFQGEPLGLAHAVKVAHDFIKDSPFVMYLGDNLLKDGIRKIVKEFKSKRPECAIALCSVPNPQMFGVAELDKEGRVVNLVEKPREPKSSLALVGVYLFRKSIFKAIKNIIPSWRGELEITDAIDWLIKNGMKVESHIVEGWWKDTGLPDDLIHANSLLLEDLKKNVKGVVEKGAKINGNVSIGAGSRITKGSSIEGPVIIGDNCIIENSRIGPNTSVGGFTVVRDSDIESSIVMGESHVECGVKLVDSIIGNNTSILTSKKKRDEGNTIIVGDNSQIAI
ncbi:MAG: glucose-1-phosphate thymidylyltransferase [Candidatus Altiarchaeota archaeon]